ncbi:RNA polymerase sigma factor [Parapedobacter sp. DT-150]|uniref:RNA polymerase sigma factor n=1 Tax=Parapedobacter sp. DT-150 TaxID=3396162 RepID=UPI003F1A26D6
MDIKFDEEAILNRLKQDDSQAFEAIYRRYWERLFNQAYNHLRDENDTKELIQDLFAEFWQRRHTLDIHTSLSGYLQSALKFKVFNYMKATVVREKYATTVKQHKFVSHSPVEEAINYAELQVALHTALQMLPTQPRRVYELRQGDGLSYAEIANALHISISTVEKHMMKALKHIRRRLKQFNHR